MTSKSVLTEESLRAALGPRPVDELGFCRFCRCLVALDSFNGTTHVVKHDGARECREIATRPAMATLGPIGEASWISWTLEDCGVFLTCCGQDVS